MVPPVAVQRKVTVKTPERPSSWLLKDGLRAHICSTAKEGGTFSLQTRPFPPYSGN